MFDLFPRAVVASVWIAFIYIQMIGEVFGQKLFRTAYSETVLFSGNMNAWRSNLPQDDGRARSGAGNFPWP